MNVLANMNGVQPSKPHRDIIVCCSPTIVQEMMKGGYTIRQCRETRPLSSSEKPWPWYTIKVVVVLIVNRTTVPCFGTFIRGQSNV
ncbi:hypothetical protein AG1IA_07567 [Rhizoctonia solani AG-1 IA]|uniref:Uncharacterized protein n=1 Tax=Thanatephorus cucumeris (strain AG1-IA) TaxID=983506 RepID=L8WNR2_THACA|nr:hypothetical protein AG1IA_07567 [Rhizoctonia solani AG-1 IA]